MRHARQTVGNEMSNVEIDQAVRDWNDALVVAKDATHVAWVADRTARDTKAIADAARAKRDVQKDKFMKMIGAAEKKAAEEHRHVLMELRTRLHVAGRRPEECYEMSLIDAAIARGAA